MFSKPKKLVISPNKDLYHGSNVKFRRPKPDVNELPCDLGKGFYLTGDWDRAVRRAKEKSESGGSTEKWVLKFVFDDVKANRDAEQGKLWLKVYDENKEWLDVVTNFWDPSMDDLLEHSKIEGIIISPSSDARIPIVLDEYRSSPRAEDDVKKALFDLEPKKFGIQYVFGSKAAIRKYLKFAGAYRIE